MAKREKEISTGRVYFDRGGTGPEKIIKAEHVDTPMEPYFADDPYMAAQTPVTLNFLDNGVGSKPLVIMDPENDRVIITNLHLHGSLTGVNRTHVEFLHLSASVGLVGDLWANTIRVKKYGVARKYGFGNDYERWTEYGPADQVPGFDPEVRAPIHISHTNDGIGLFNDGQLRDAHLLIGGTGNGIGMDDNQIAKAGGHLIFETEGDKGYYFKTGGKKAVRLYGGVPGGSNNSSAIYMYNAAELGSSAWNSQDSYWRMRISEGTVTGFSSTYLSLRFNFDRFAKHGPSSEDAGHSFGPDVIAYLEDSTEPTRLNTYEFTGQHRCRPHSSTSLKELNAHPGKIVVSAGNIHNRESKTRKDSSKIELDSAIPGILLSSEVEQKSVIGVISTVEEEGKDREYAAGALVSVIEKVKGDERVVINSLGEGAVWVCNVGGNFENGDYITTSAHAGYGIKQRDDILHNYTVAKITMDCNFDLRSAAYECVEMRETDRRGNKYRAALVACTYHCG